MNKHAMPTMMMKTIANILLRRGTQRRRMSGAGIARKSSSALNKSYSPTSHEGQGGRGAVGWGVGGLWAGRVRV